MYPTTAPNGSAIIIYGHQRGITIIWRGGRPFRNTPKQSQGSKKNAVAIVDDDDESTQSQENGLLDFDDEELEFNPENPFDKVVHTEEIQLDNEVLRIAIPNIPSDITARTEYSMPPVLGQKIIIAAACADGSVRLFSLGVTPNRRADSRGLDELSVVDAQLSSLAISQGLSLTWTGRQRLNSAHGEEESPPDWSFLLANHTSVAGGVLSVYHIALARNGAALGRSDAVTLLQEETVQNPRGAISFSSSHYPSRRHTQLLVATAGAIRLYEPLPRTKYHHHQQQSQPGSWLASFHVPFESCDPATVSRWTFGQRSHILDAQWTSDGQCVIVLLGDGQWGLWDIEGIAPESSKPAKRGNTFASSSGISGGGITRFALRGFVGEHAAALAAKFDVSSGQGSIKESKKLTPMTPNTRRVKQQALFSGPTATSTLTALSIGGISVSRVPANKDGSRADDSIILWYENTLYAIPSLLSHWQRAANGSSDSSSLTALPGFSSYNEDIISVSQAFSPSTRPSSSSTRPTTSIQHDVIISTSHRLLLLCPSRPTPQTPDGAVRRLFASDISEAQPDTTASIDMDVDEEDVMRLDQDMLSKGQLDLGGLDRMLSGMNAGGKVGFGVGAGTRASGDLFGNGGTQSRTRRVGFAAGF